MATCATQRKQNSPLVIWSLQLLAQVYSAKIRESRLSLRFGEYVFVESKFITFTC